MIIQGGYPSGRALWKSDGTLRQFYVYILSNASMRMYTGITNDLVRRFGEHLRGECRFTSRYHFDRIVYVETYYLVVDAIFGEKRVKGLSRKRKIALVKRENPEWVHLLG